MAGDFAGHLLGCVHEDITGEDGFEPGLGDGSWIGTGGAHGAEDLGSLAVLGWRDLFEVGERPVEFVAVNVVDLHAFGARTDEGLIDEMMAEAVAVIAHTGVSRTPFVRIRRSRISAWFEFASFGVVESAVGAGEESFAAYRFRRHLFDNRYSHNASDSGMLSEIRCKGRYKKKESRISGLVRDFRDYFGIFGIKSGLNRD